MSYNIKPNKGLVKLYPEWVWSAVQAQDNCTVHTQQESWTGVSQPATPQQSAMLSDINQHFCWEVSLFSPSLRISHLNNFLLCFYPSSYCILASLTASSQIQIHYRCTYKNLISLRTRPRQSKVKDMAITAACFVLPRKKKGAAFPFSITNALIRSDWDPCFLSLLRLSRVGPMRNSAQTQKSVL